VHHRYKYTLFFRKAVHFFLFCEFFFQTKAKNGDFEREMRFRTNQENPLIK